MKIPELPEPLRSLANMREMARNGAEPSLDAAFEWEETPERHVFWATVNNGYFDQAYKIISKEECARRAGLSATTTTPTPAGISAFKEAGREILLEQAMKRYPIGCRPKCLCDPLEADGVTITPPNWGFTNENEIWAEGSGGYDICLYRYGKWADIIEDGEKSPGEDVKLTGNSPFSTVGILGQVGTSSPNFITASTTAQIDEYGGSIRYMTEREIARELLDEMKPLTKAEPDLYQDLVVVRPPKTRRLAAQRVLEDLIEF